MNIGLLLHETRHVDGFDHTIGCCTSGGQCDQSLDFNNPSSYGIMVWWTKAIWEKKYEFGLDGLVQNDAYWRNSIKVTINPNTWSKFFCDDVYTFEFPVDGFTNCEF